ncbi:DNA translocase FtsK [Candidatus Methylacidithermus pantelleriae]|uniref:FtsK domain-containing protein n=1 Tax=Candidatus Methylacidithermus pantelleriae TaxID=2744239 RepID=A0A8J2BMB9_9BACT|nr:DNA translocase FtsK [Candidatus Methylacidithermus pantelleriae]CAF0705327.1 hypothetical protein MPNT_90062 [Candidatus Methylacidithermus pantelleriae]
MNPFFSQRVDDPWEIEPAVPGLNDLPLHTIVSFFSQLKPGQRLGRALVVVSPESGYGKSHLIGRLFQELRGRAIRVCLRPFEAPERCWERILDRILAELARIDPTAARPGRTQLAQFAALTIGHLAADLLEQKLVTEIALPARWRSHFADLCVLLRTDPLSLWEGPDSESWTEWISRPDISSCFLMGLWTREIELSSRNPHSWIKVFLGYLSHAGDPYRRRLCIEWIRATSLDPEEIAFLRLSPDDVPVAECPVEESDERAKERILDLCRLARFSWPFVFCFDQTEAFAQEPKWAARFGYVVAELVDQAPNLMIVIAANQEPWEKRILPWMEGAYSRRMYLSPDLHLSGVNENQAHLFLQNRLRRAGVDSERAERFLGGEWFSELFRKAKMIGIGRLLQEAEKQWDRKPRTLSQCYEEILDRMKQERPPFDLDALQWIVREGGHSLPSWETEEPYPGRKKHLLLRWKGRGTSVGFGLERSSNWRRWEAIAREAMEEAKRPTGCQRLIFLRSFDEPAVPGERWKSKETIDVAASRGPLRIVVLKEDVWLEFAALHHLYTKVLEGDLEFSRDETLALVREKLRPWAEKLVAGVGSQEVGTDLERTGRSQEVWQVLNVSELVKGCLRETHGSPWDARERGEIFHKIVGKFIQWLFRVDPDPQDPETYWRVQWDLAKSELTKANVAQDVEEVSRIEAALRQFHTNLKRLATSAGVSAWKELFEGTEIPVSGTFLLQSGRYVRIEGRVDTLRRHPKEGRQLVDYKLCGPSSSPRDLLQLAIYAELLAQDAKTRSFSGILEYYTPALIERKVSREELHAIFTEHVSPVLENIAKESRAARPQAELDTYIKETSRKLEQFYAHHGLAVSCAWTNTIRAPQVLRFRLSCPPGVRVEKLRSLASTLRVQLSLDFEPLIEPAAGFIAVNLPNPHPFLLPWEDAYRRMPEGLALPLLLGQTIEGEILARDLADPNTPHVLVAGASGSGKSMLLKCIVATLCKALSPERLELLLIDPKMTTFRPWEETPYLRDRGLLTEMDKTLEALKETVDEMDQRYQILCRERFESINQRIAAGKTDIPYRVIVFDEFADWLLKARRVKQQFEDRIARIAQKGRGAGIHLILATQRPEKNVVTGLIRANLPVRICFRVSSSKDSEIALGKGGGEKLFGKGDLFCNLGPGGNFIRAQAPFLDT